MSDVVILDSPGRLSRHNMVDPANRLRNPAQEEALLTQSAVIPSPHLWYIPGWPGLAQL